MRKLTATLIGIIAATSALAQFAAPPLKHVIEANSQQTQELLYMPLQQGASVNYQVSFKSNGKWRKLAGLTARWEAREVAGNTNAYVAVSSATVTNVTPNYFQIDIDSTQTGTAFTNWVYTVVVDDGVGEFVYGEGRVDSEASAWTGASGILTNVTYLQTVAVDGVTITGDGTAGNPLVAIAGAGTVTNVTSSGRAVSTGGPAVFNIDVPAEADPLALADLATHTNLSLSAGAHGGDSVTNTTTEAFTQSLTVNGGFDSEDRDIVFVMDSLPRFVFEKEGVLMLNGETVAGSEYTLSVSAGSVGNGGIWVSGKTMMRSDAVLLGDLDLALGGDITNAGTVTAVAFVGDGSGLTGISGGGAGGYRELISSSEFNPTASGAPDTPYTNGIPAIQPDDGNNETLVTEYRQVYAGETNYTVEAYWYADSTGDYVWSVMGNQHTTTITSTDIGTPTFESWTFNEAVPATGMIDIMVLYLGADAGTTAGSVITTWFSLQVAK